MPTIRTSPYLNPVLNVDPPFGRSSAGRVMSSIDRSGGLPPAANVQAQARATVIALAKAERDRQIMVTKGYVAAANKTLQGMGALFAAGPTTAEMQSVLKNAVTDGGIISGRDYYDRIQKGLQTSYSKTSNTPENLKAYAQRAADNVSGAVPAPLVPYIRPSIQAASYVYATKQAQQTGAALAGIPDSVVDRMRLTHLAQERATYLMGLAGAPSIEYRLAGLGGIDTSHLNLSNACTSLSHWSAPNAQQRIDGVKAAFQYVFGSQPNDTEISYYGAMYWCAWANDDFSKSTMAGVMRQIKDAGGSTTPGRDAFPGGAAAFDSSFRVRPGFGFSASELGAFIGQLIGGATGGGGTGASVPCAGGPACSPGFYCNGSKCVQIGAEETDWTTYALYAAGAAALFFVVRSQMKKSA
jgi:hypothetical protein